MDEILKEKGDKTMRTTLFTCFITLISPYVFSDVVAERTLPSEIYIPGSKLMVYIKVTGDSGPITVIEKPPSGWEVNTVRKGGQFSDGVITWELASITRVVYLTYYITPPITATEQVSFSGNIDNLEIGGMTDMESSHFRFGTPRKIEIPIGNSPGSPWISANNLILLFTCNPPIPDLWMLERETEMDGWGPPIKLSEIINTRYEEFNSSLSKDGLTLFFSSNRNGGNCDLWMSTRDSLREEWKEPVPFNQGVNSRYDEMDPRISSDNLSLYFISDRPGGYGLLDIWVSARTSENEDWGDPVNLGPIVNSSEIDINPCISADNLMLFYSSYRTGGRLTDIFVTTRATANDAWRIPVNLGSTINTSGAESGPSISFDNSVLYYDHSETWNTDVEIWQVPLEWLVTSTVSDWRLYE